MPIRNFGAGTPRLSEGIIVSGSDSTTYAIYASGSVEAEDLALDKSVEPAIAFSIDGDARAKISINTSNNLVLHNQYTNKHIVFKVNDQGTTREGLRIDGAVPEVVVNEGSDSLVDFRVETNSDTHALFVDGANEHVRIDASQGLHLKDLSAVPNTPSSGFGVIYVYGDTPYFKSDGGTATSLIAAGGGGTPAGSDTEIQFNDGGSNFGASSNLTWDDTELKISGTGTSALLNLQTTENSSTASPVLELTRVSSSPADADYLGQIKFVGKHSNGGVTTYAKITGKIDDASGNSEDGIIEFSNVKGGGQTITARLKSDVLQLINSTDLTVDGKVGVGTTSPQATVHIHSDSINDGTVTISQSDNSSDASQLDLSKSRGSGASPTAVQNSDFIGQVRMLGYDGDSYDNFADIYAQAAGTISNTSHPTKVVIRTTQVSATSPTTAVTIDENQGMTVAGSVYGKMMHMTHHRYNDGSGTGKEYIPWAGTSEQPSPSYISQGVAPYTGRLRKVLVRSSKSGGLGSTEVGIHIGTDGNTTFNSTPEETVTVNMASANTTGTFNFTSNNHFAAGDTIAVSIDPTNAHGNVNVTCVWEYDITA